MRAGRGLVTARRAGILLGLSLMGFAAIGPFLTANRPSQQFGEFVYAPPMRPHIVGGRRTSAVAVRISAAAREPPRASLREDRSRSMPLRFFANGSIVSVDPVVRRPLVSARRRRARTGPVIAAGAWHRAVSGGRLVGCAWRARHRCAAWRPRRFRRWHDGRCRHATSRIC